jgi:hypothetical protein
MWNPNKSKILNALKLDVGSHRSMDQSERDLADMQVCVMEAVNYIQHRHIGDDPPCVSKVITDLMIARNDSVGHDERQALKCLVPDIIHTAPTEKCVGRVVTATRNRSYMRAEADRAATVNDFVQAWNRKRSDYDYDEIEDIVDELSVRKFNKLIRELADVARFE